MKEIGLSLAWYWVAYLIVTLIGVLHTVFNIMVLKMKPMDEHSMGEGYEKTKPFHVLYNLAIFPLFAFIYLNGLDALTLSDVLYAALFWGVITIVVDYIGWVLIKHPWALSVKEFYVDYQPWISLIYLTIIASPFIAYAFV